ncbi:MAG: hypothetical protein ACYCO9_17240 [Streptosporangiaceae bacterium]
MIISHAIEAQRQPYRRFRENRNSGRNQHFDPENGWPGPRYMALHTLSHLLIRRIAIECGYNSASLGERIYTGSGLVAPVLVPTHSPEFRAAAENARGLVGQRRACSGCDAQRGEAAVFRLAPDSCDLRPAVRFCQGSKIGVADLV